MMITIADCSSLRRFDIDSRKNRTVFSRSASLSACESAGQGIAGIAARRARAEADLVGAGERSGPSLREKQLVECRIDSEFVDGLPDRRLRVGRLDVAEQGGGVPLRR